MNGWALLQRVRRLSRSPDYIFVVITFEIRSGNTQLLHFVDERSALQAKFGSGTFWAADHPADSLKRAQNQIALGIL